MSNLETIELQALGNVVGGAGDGDGYNAGDGVRGGFGALIGGLTGGPIGAVVGGGAGFMSRKVGQLADGVQDLWNENQRAKQLEAQRQQMLQRRQQQPQPGKP